jgi:DUF4097 and DUF4098 domain-containing protein YvlB
MKKISIILASVFCMILLASCLVACNIVITDADYKTTNHNQIENFENIYIDTDIANVIIKKTDGTCKVTCFETDRIYHKVKVENGTLKIESAAVLNVHTIGQFRPLSVTVYLPDKEYGNLEIETDTGNISIESDFVFNKIDISCDTGNISMDTIKCSTLSAESDTGNVYLSDTVASATLNVHVDTGNIHLSDCDAPVISLETALGDVRGSLLTGKTFVAKSDLGDVDVPANDPTGGVCTINTDLGDIDIKIA